MMARTPDLSCIWSELTSKPRRESISSWFKMRSALPPPSPPSGAGVTSAPSSAAASTSGVSSAILQSLLLVAPASPTLLLNDHLLEQHVAHFIWRGRDIDPAQQFFLHAQHPARSFEIVDAQFAQIGLKLILDARHQGGDAGLFQIIVELQRDRQFQISGGRIRALDIDQKIVHVVESDLGRGELDFLNGLFLGRSFENEEID